MKLPPQPVTALGLYRRRAQRQYLDAGIGSGQMLQQLGFSLGDAAGRPARQP